MNNKNKPILIFRTVITSRNYDKLEDFIIFASKQNVKKIEFNQLNADKGSFAENLMLKEKQKQELKKKIKLYNQVATINKIDVSFNLDIFQNKIKKNKFNCFIPWTELLVRPNGSVSICCHIHNDVGDIRNDGLKEIWLGKKYNLFRKKLLDNELHKKCTKCDMAFNPNNNFLLESINKNE